MKSRLRPVSGIAVMRGRTFELDVICHLRQSKNLMKKSHNVIIFIIFTFGCAVKPSHTEIHNYPKIDDTLPNNAIKQSFLTMTSSASFDQMYLIKVNGIKYNVSVNDKNNINFIITIDPRFLTSEGTSVGTSYKDLRKFTKSKLFRINGYAYLIDLPSGWTAAFTQGHTMTEGELSNKAVVNWYQRK